MAKPGNHCHYAAFRQWLGPEAIDQFGQATQSIKPVLRVVITDLLLGLRKIGVGPHRLKLRPLVPLVERRDVRQKEPGFNVSKPRVRL